MTSHIGVNLLWLRPGRVGGSEEYLVRLLTAMADQADPELDLTVFASPAFAAAHPSLASTLTTVPSPGAVSRVGRVARIALEATWLARQARRYRLDLLHHAGGTVPARNPVPVVVTIHDLQVYDHPAYFSPVKRAYLYAALPRAATRSRLVLTPSEFVKSTVVDRLGVDASRVAVVPHGIPDREGAGEPVPVDVLRHRYELPERWVFYPAITHPHKNHVVLVRAAARLADRYDDLAIVLTGASGRAESDVLAEASRLGVTDRLRRPGRVPAADVDALYRYAVACVFPSRYEGFGAPVLEAMRWGCPVVSSTAGSLPEVIGEAGILLDPDDVDAWAAAIARLADDADERERLARAGRARARAFTGARSAAALALAYRRALGSAV